MASLQKIPLRILIRKIDELIIDHQSGEAISRSLSLLQEFPKNFAVYQLLGKALLDKQEFETATKVFEKILDIDPDDFVSHIGISIISENFGNSNKALESMNRAYELQPSNESLQNEVKRLQESTTGFAPEQVRLTRGTLIKMYSRSELAEQTIAEARLGIQEMPDRIDYKIHLAKMLEFSGRTMEAIETCTQILSFYPYCKDALLILDRITTSSSDNSESSVYKSRLTELDPYYAFMKTDTKSVNDIPDIAVMVLDQKGPGRVITDINDFIGESWSKQINPDVPFVMATEPEDWTSIINDAVSQESVGNPLVSKDYEEVSLSSENLEDIPTFESHDEQQGISAKDKLLRKLRSNSSFEKDMEAAPDWVFDDEQDIEFEDTIEPSPEEPSSSGFETDGMTDHNSPIPDDIEILSSKIHDSQFWEMEHTGHHSKNHIEKTDNLQDTQKIKIASDDFEELKRQAFRSIVDDPKFSKRCFSKLIEKNYDLQNIAEKLEVICKENPKNIELWLTLVEVYRKLGIDEKALSTLIKAQNNLSFK